MSLIGTDTNQVNDDLRDIEASNNDVVLDDGGLNNADASMLENDIIPDGGDFPDEKENKTFSAFDFTALIGEDATAVTALLLGSVGTFLFFRNFIKKE
jgi:hypothetical protein